MVVWADLQEPLHTPRQQVLTGRVFARPPLAGRGIIEVQQDRRPSCPEKMGLCRSIRRIATCGRCTCTGHVSEPEETMARFVHVGQCAR